MRERILSCIYPFVQEFMNSPISVQLIVAAGGCTEEEVSAVFQELAEKNMLMRKHELNHVYQLNAEGFNAVKKAYESTAVSSTATNMAM